jgi:trimethylamine--corrinoid protein Co-methyltransferase
MLRDWSEFFSPAEVEEIHKTSMEVLANVGVRFPEDDAIGVFRKHGVKTDGQMVYLTDSHIPDARAGFESMHGLLAPIMGGVDFVLHAAGILSSFLAFSYEKFVIDDEMCGMVRRFRRGIAVTEETLAYDVIAGVGPGGNYLMEPHTLERCRTEFWQPTKGTRMGLEKWLEAGRPDELARARTRWQELLREHQDPPLEAVVARQLAAFLKERGA